jgi:diaminopimelate epimerase
VTAAVRTIPYVKACACGNDFLLIEGSLAPDDLPGFTRRICDRHEGVGADGVEWMYPHFSANVEARLVNADGSAAEVSGNGTRCVAAFICSEFGKEKITVQTGAGMKLCMLMGRRGAEYEFETEMGEAAVGEELALGIGHGEVRGFPVSMGNPHYVRFVQQFAEGWQRDAAETQRRAEFNQGVNVELAVMKGKHDMDVRFFERGVGETLSSGTGSCAAAVAAMATNKAESPVRVHAPGGTQTVRWERNLVFLRGPARLVCRGDFFLS